MVRLMVVFIFIFFAGIVYAKDPLPGSALNKRLILQLINDARKKGCTCGSEYYAPSAPLSWNELLEKAAIEHSSQMVEKRFFSHTSDNGFNAGDRIQKAGYNWKNYGENIGMGYRDEKEMVEAWLKSPGHCRNIMNAQYKEMGVARVGEYWTQDFGTK